MKTGLQLYTKDGRRTGNAIVLGRIEHATIELWLCETDFGKRFAFSPREIETHFHTRTFEGEERITPPETWRGESAEWKGKPLPDGLVIS